MLVATLWHEDVYEDQLVGQATVDLTDVLHERVTLEVWVPLLDEPPLPAPAPSCCSACSRRRRRRSCGVRRPPVTIEGLERTILQDPAQCDEREVADEGTGRLCVHLLLENKLATDEMLSLLLKANTKQARVADRHGNLALHYVCKRYAVTEAQLTLTLRCHPGGAAAANRFGKLPLHLLSRNPCLTKGMLHLLLARAAALTARDQARNTPLHYLAQNKSLSKEVLQAFLAACGEEGGKAAVEATNKYGAVPLRKLVTSDAFTDQHLRVMLRTLRRRRPRARSVWPRALGLPPCGTEVTAVPGERAPTRCASSCESSAPRTPAVGAGGRRPPRCPAPSARRRRRRSRRRGSSTT